MSSVAVVRQDHAEVHEPRLDQAAYCPRSCRQRERRIRQPLPTTLTQLSLLRGVERRYVGAGGPHTEGEGPPPLLEGRVLDTNRKSGLLHLVQSGLAEELGEVAFATAGQLRFVLYVRVDLVNGLPERRQRRLLAGVIPDARGYHTTRTRDAFHLREPADGVRHEVDDKLRERCVELSVGERQVLRGRAPDVDPRMALARGGDELLRRIDGRDLRRTDALHQHARERAGAAADVEHALP